GVVVGGDIDAGLRAGGLRRWDARAGGARREVAARDLPRRQPPHRLHGDRAGGRAVKSASPRIALALLQPHLPSRGGGASGSALPRIHPSETQRRRHAPPPLVRRQAGSSGVEHGDVCVLAGSGRVEHGDAPHPRPSRKCCPRPHGHTPPPLIRDILR
ncbi:hypothetical protein T484DRAFT_1883074, partial [Baffinella frigidus]